MLLNLNTKRLVSLRYTMLLRPSGGIIIAHSRTSSVKLNEYYINKNRFERINPEVLGRIYNTFKIIRNTLYLLIFKSNNNKETRFSIWTSSYNTLTSSPFNASGKLCFQLRRNSYETSNFKAGTRLICERIDSGPRHSSL